MITRGPITSLSAIRNEFNPADLSLRRKRLDVVITVHSGLRDEARAPQGREPGPECRSDRFPVCEGLPDHVCGQPGLRRGQESQCRGRFIVVDALDLLLTVLVVPASRQDRGGARQLLVDH